MAQKFANMDETGQPLAPLLAIVGTDGSGKSTIAPQVVDWLNNYCSAELCYLGQGSGKIGDRIKQFKLGGKAFERYLSRKASRARDKNDKIPGIVTASIMYYFTLVRVRRFRRMLDLRRRGVTVVTDRYPQVDVAGFYDGPSLSAARAEGPLVRKLVDKERKLFEWMVRYLPDLVVRLNVDVDTALARKPDHPRALVSRKVAVSRSLTFNGAHIVDIDAHKPYQTVLAETLSAVREALVARGYDYPLPPRAQAAE